MPSRPSDSMLHAFAADLLDPGEAYAMRRAAQADGGVAQELVALKERLQTFGVHALGGGAAALTAQAAPLLEGAPSAELTLRVPRACTTAAHKPVLLHTDGGVVEVLHPTSATRFVPLSRLPQDEEGWQLRVVLPHPQAALTVLLLPADAVFEDPQEEEPWRDARALARQGSITAWIVERGAV